MGPQQSAIPQPRRLIRQHGHLLLEGLEQRCLLSGWTIVPAATVVSANDVWAVGEAGSQTLTEHWNGSTWSIVPSPNGGGGFQSVLLGVSAVSSNQVWAVGFSGNGAPGQTLTEQWNGSSWNLVASPNPGNLTNGLSAAAALPTGQVWAVGSFSNLINGQPGPNQSLILSRTSSSSPATTSVVPPSTDQPVDRSAVAAIFGRQGSQPALLGLQDPASARTNPQPPSPGLPVAASSQLPGAHDASAESEAAPSVRLKARRTLDLLFREFYEDEHG